MDAAVSAVEPGRQPAVSPAVSALLPASGKEVNREICRKALAAMALLRDPWLAAAFDTVDREEFVPSAAWLPVQDEDGLWRFVDRDTDAATWREAVWNPSQSVITQLDDGYTSPTGPAAGDFTSSVSALDVVLRKLHHLDLQEHHHVLEIGYASGYHTALLCERVTSSRVTAVEVDEGLASWGAENLKRAGYEPQLVHGDGMLGVPEAEPFDRIINTAAVRHVPGVWIRQSSQNGLILTPFGTAYSNAGLLRLRVDGGKAEGQFVGESAYMWIRSERPSVDLRVPDESASRPSPIAPTQVLGGGYLQDFAIGLQVPDVSYSHRGEGDDRQVQFVDEAGTSATIVRYSEWWEEDAVRSWGPRDLWAEVTSAHTWYEGHDRPYITRFGVTVNRVGQRVWLDSPDHLIN